VSVPCVACGEPWPCAKAEFPGHRLPPEYRCDPAHVQNCKGHLPTPAPTRETT
jgi:hypothetical protein